MELLKKTIEKITGINEKAMEEAQVRLDNLLKPQGSLGKLEYIAKKLTGITGKVNNHIDKKTIIVMASDNGVYEEKVASFPKEVSVLVANTMVTGLSGVAVLAKHAGAGLKIVDIGLDTDQIIDGIINKKIRKGTGNIATGPAMSSEEAIKAIEIGIEITNQAIDEGANLIGTGEVGIANTTTSSAVLYAITKGSLDDIVGRGAGLDDEGLKIKKEVVKKSFEKNKPNTEDPIDILSKVGGFDIAGLVGCYLACASRRVPVVIDGFISGVAAILAGMIKKESKEYMIPSHITDEPGGKMINQILGFEPFLKMDMRLGEGTGCAIAFTIIEAATAMMNKMGTFKDIGM